MNISILWVTILPVAPLKNHLRGFILFQMINRGIIVRGYEPVRPGFLIVPGKPGGAGGGCRSRFLESSIATRFIQYPVWVIRQRIANPLTPCGRGPVSWNFQTSKNPSLFIFTYPCPIRPLIAFLKATIRV